MWVYLCLWRLQPYGRNSEPCPRHSRSLGKWKNSPPPQMWCPAQDGKIQKKKKRVWVRKPVTNQERIIPAVLPEPLDHCSPVKNQPNIVMTRPVTTQWHFGSSSAVWHKVQEEVGRGSRHTWMNDVPRTERGNRRAKTHMHMYTSKQTHSCHGANELICKGKWAAGVRR